jgi:hypothetical protein
VINKAPEIVGKRILLTEVNINHRQHWSLAFVKARQEKRYDGFLDVVWIEVGGNRRAKALDGGQDLLRKRRLCCVGGSRL